MKHLKKFDLFLEEIDSNTSQEPKPNQKSSQESQRPIDDVKNTSQEPKPNQKSSQASQRPSDEVDSILQDAETQKQKIVARKDAIEKGLLNNIRDLEPDNQKDVKNQVQDYRTQVQEFDKTVKQIDKLNQTLKKSNREIKYKPYIQNAKDKTKF